MLPSGRSVDEYNFACDEGVMGFHNDRRTGGNMPANDRQKVICFIIVDISLHLPYKQARDCIGYKATSYFVYLGRFSP